MRVAVLADVHANLAALHAVLRECDAQRVDQTWFLGDLVGYGAEPAACLHALQPRTARWIRGNHDAELANTVALAASVGCGSPGDLLARTQFTAQELLNVAHAPDSLRFSECGREVLICHGAPWDPLGRVYPDASQELLQRAAAEGGEITLMGHTHWAFSVICGGRLLANPGSVGQARDVRGTASWGILDVQLCSWTPMRTPYSA
jgi:putative phosphoesterase